MNNSTTQSASRPPAGLNNDGIAERADAVVARARDALEGLGSAAEARRRRSKALLTLLSKIAQKHGETVSAIRDRDGEIGRLKSENDAFRTRCRGFEEMNRRLHETLTWLIDAVEKSSADVLSDEQRIQATLLVAEEEMNFLGSGADDYLGESPTGSMRDLISRIESMLGDGAPAGAGQ